MTVAPPQTPLGEIFGEAWGEHLTQEVNVGTILEQSALVPVQELGHFKLTDALGRLFEDQAVHTGVVERSEFPLREHQIDAIEAEGVLSVYSGQIRVRQAGTVANDEAAFAGMQISK